MIRYLPKPIVRNQEEQVKFRWKTFWWLLIMFVSAAVANIPHARAVKELTSKARDFEHQSILQSIIGNAGAALILGFVFIWIGLWVSARANLGAPLIVKKLTGKTFSNTFDRKTILTTVLIGSFVGFLLLLLLKVQEYILPMETANFRHPSAIPNLFASFSAGITEEIIFRLGIMSLIITAILYLTKAKIPSNKTTWIGILLTALIFGLIHIPMSGKYYELTPIVIGTTVLGNVITGTTFGWIFWRYGLIMAMLAHFIFDVVFHVIGTPFG
ncbi:CPBP family intramembrane metalloprotease [Galbibacter sp. EGI 63066]|uniref:CPBP family intramembrane glutamic endopeptidase n=1 Tax=Galbibacter sp. EGI 63066 TaxID=2993559 RepID=UPI0022493D32|nr:CPBP family intramembrane glutamic endopeptidase [Galbibacter sp. EGI 63066]MCX2680075.1 CPBP family intramembrane metalloprotease [Galbibacter sp. EGI 63066]